MGRGFESFFPCALSLTLVEPLFDPWYCQRKNLVSIISTILKNKVLRLCVCNRKFSILGRFLKVVREIMIMKWVYENNHLFFVDTCPIVTKSFLKSNSDLKRILATMTLSGIVWLQIRSTSLNSSADHCCSHHNAFNNSRELYVSFAIILWKTIFANELLQNKIQLKYLIAEKTRIT